MAEDSKAPEKRHDHTCLASAELCELVSEIDDGEHGGVLSFAVVLLRADRKLSVLASSNIPNIDAVRKLLAGGAQMVLATMPAPTDTRN